MNFLIFSICYAENMMLIARVDVPKVGTSWTTSKNVAKCSYCITHKCSRQLVAIFIALEFSVKNSLKVIISITNVVRVILKI